MITAFSAVRRIHTSARIFRDRDLRNHGSTTGHERSGLSLIGDGTASHATSDGKKERVSRFWWPGAYPCLAPSPAPLIVRLTPRLPALKGNGRVF